MSKLSEDFDEKTKFETTKERLERFYNIIEESIVNLFPKKEAFKNEDEKKDKKRNKIPNNIRIMLRKKTSLSKKILTSNSGKRTLKLMNSLKIVEEELESSYKTTRLKKEKEALGKMKKDPNFFYTYANKYSKTKTKVGPLLNENGETIKDPYEMAEILRKQYESTFTKADEEFNIESIGEFFFMSENATSSNLPSTPNTGHEANEVEEDGQVGVEEDIEEPPHTTTEDNEEDEEVIKDPDATDEEVEGLEGVGQNSNINLEPPHLTDIHFDYMDIADAIEQLSGRSGPGPDGIPAILLKKAKITVSLILKNIFQHSMDTAEIPDILKLGFICPILKPECLRERAASWRPVSLTSHIIKTLERVLRRKIVSHLEDNNLMNPDQHGSRQRRSCLSQLLEHHDEILKMMEEGNNVDVIYTDFEKAFEKVDHLKLLQKMKKQLGIQGKIGKWIQNFLKRRKQQVLIEETKSEESKVTSGAVQGSVLGPIFFLIFISDMTKDVTANIKLFVDDAKVKDTINDEEDVEELQSNLDKLYDWEK